MRGSQMRHAQAIDEEAPVVIVGGGGAGLTASMLLAHAGEEGQDWCEAAWELASRSALPLDAVRIGHLDGDLFDPRCTWLRRREIGSDGAILVRPGRLVAWRSMGACENSLDELAAALGQILARPIPS